MKDNPKGAPPVTPKSKMRQSLDRWEKSDTGGDPYDRSQGRYSKNTPQKELDYDDEL